MIKRNIAIMYISVSLYGICSGFLSWFIPIVLYSIGLPILALTYSLIAVLGITLPMVGGVLADFLGRKIVMIISVIIIEMGLLALYCAFLSSNALLVLIGAALFFAGGDVGGPTSRALFMESCDKGNIGRIFSVAATLHTASMIIGAILFEHMLNLIPTHGLILIMNLVFAGVVISRFFIIETVQRRHIDRASIIDRFYETLKLIATDRKLSRYTSLRMLLFMFGWFWILFPAVLRYDYGFDYELIAMYFSISIALSGLPSPIGGVFVDKYGIRKAFIVSIIIDFSLLFSFFIVVGFNPIVGFLMLVFAASVTWFEGAAHNVLMFHITDDDHRAQFFGVLDTLGGVAELISPWIMYIMYNMNALLALVIPVIVNILVDFFIVIFIYTQNVG